MFVALGVVLVRRLSVLTPPLLLGGVLLILFGAPTASEGGLGQVGSLLGAFGPVLGTVGDAGDGREIARFVVLLVGVLLLMGLLYARRERVPSDGGVAKSRPPKSPAAPENLTKVEPGVD